MQLKHPMSCLWWDTINISDKFLVIVCVLRKIKVKHVLNEPFVVIYIFLPFFVSNIIQVQWEEINDGWICLRDNVFKIGVINKSTRIFLFGLASKMIGMTMLQVIKKTL